MKFAGQLLVESELPGLYFLQSLLVRYCFSALPELCFGQGPQVFSGLLPEACPVTVPHGFGTLHNVPVESDGSGQAHRKQLKSQLSRRNFV